MVMIIIIIIIIITIIIMTNYLYILGQIWEFCMNSNFRDNY